MIPGKDIFALDKVIFPINIGNTHWARAVIFTKRKTIQYYASMGAGRGKVYLTPILK
jgi:Ulp1 family protease